MFMSNKEALEILSWKVEKQHYLTNIEANNAIEAETLIWQRKIDKTKIQFSKLSLKWIIKIHPYILNSWDAL